MKVFSSEKNLLPYHVLNVYGIDLYFLEHKLAVEVDENEHKEI